MKQKSESMKPDAAVAPGNSTATTDVIGRTPMVPKEPVSTEAVTRRPVEGQATEAGGVAGELADHAKYRADFGVYAPDPEQLAASLKRAQGLTEEAARANAWAAHVTAQRDLAWDDALARMDQLAEPFALADAKNATVAQRYPRTRAFYGVRGEIAARAAATRKKNRAKQPK
ncbi:MAG: hypothetical protein U0324_04200 [Polyangiales bacterium]